MTHNIIPDLIDKAADIDSVIPLQKNPHSGDVEAAKAVLVEFGQHTPILVHSGTKQILAGNTRWRAAKELGWTKIAVTTIDEEESRAYARAVSDNRLSELGSDDASILAEMLPSIMEDYGEVFEVLGWDDWELVALEQGGEIDPEPSGYTPPVMIRRDPIIADQDEDSDGKTHLTAPQGSNERELIQRGGGETDIKRATVIQYTLVFESADLQRRWYQFVTWMRANPELTQYGTTAEKLIAFLEARVEF